MPADNPPFADASFPWDHQPPSPQPQPQPDRAARQLRAARRLPVRITLLLLAVHAVIVLLAAPARAVLAQPLAGPFNVGLGLLLAQLCMTAGVAVWYGRYARAAIDPLTEDRESSLPHPEGQR
ncbi:DUF485 domain-containing protein [Streptomyces sp. NPDC101151]|uniref:DUF485 domain-containing protein n=1 Tax=Streptomyces sp. NPDC101151 TaxID=3366115 RepID=UPI003808A08D